MDKWEEEFDDIYGALFDGDSSIYEDQKDFIRTQLEEAFKQGVEAVKLERFDIEQTEYDAGSGGMNEVFNEGYNQAVANLETLKASLLSPAAARVAQSMEMQEDLAEGVIHKYGLAKKTI